MLIRTIKDTTLIVLYAISGLSLIIYILTLVIDKSIFYIIPFIIFLILYISWATHWIMKYVYGNNYTIDLKED